MELAQRCFQPDTRGNFEQRSASSACDDCGWLVANSETIPLPCGLFDDSGGELVIGHAFLCNCSAQMQIR